ncbi:hypothetical protein EYF80_047734 [Liparis tanakae]|uniref:Uncharacterized protein n=1 Tax=Liparis tanakae TaxID=230148 RepID=A0A4Z2FLQ3_9TELE|nr:hypothetical protein EYF80_047734 [Liparis tanakae]
MRTPSTCRSSFAESARRPSPRVRRSPLPQTGSAPSPPSSFRGGDVEVGVADGAGFWSGKKTPKLIKKKMDVVLCLRASGGGAGLGEDESGAGGNVDVIRRAVLMEPSVRRRGPEET